MNSAVKTYVERGQAVDIELPYSEVCMHMQVAGTIMSVQLTDAGNGHVMAQLRKDGRDFSFPVGAGEAGFYQDEGGYYAYLPELPGQESRT